MNNPPSRSEVLLFRLGAGGLGSVFVFFFFAGAESSWRGEDWLGLVFLSALGLWTLKLTLKIFFGAGPETRD